MLISMAIAVVEEVAVKVKFICFKKVYYIYFLVSIDVPVYLNIPNNSLL